MKSRRGISEMVAVILVLIIVSIAGAALYRTSLVTLSSQFTSYTQQAKDQTLAAQERFEVVNVEKIDSSNVTVYLLNYSPENTIDVTVDKVYIDDIPSTWRPIVTGNSNGLLLKNVVTPIRVSSGTGFTTDNKYKIVIVSQRGTSNAFKWKCP
jgi:hypothetical protein